MRTDEKIPIVVIDEFARGIEEHMHKAGLVLCPECGLWFRPKTKMNALKQYLEAARKVAEVLE